MEPKCSVWGGEMVHNRRAGRRGAKIILIFRSGPESIRIWPARVHQKRIYQNFNTVLHAYRWGNDGPQQKRSKRSDLQIPIRLYQIRVHQSWLKKQKWSKNLKIGVNWKMGSSELVSRGGNSSSREAWLNLGQCSRPPHIAETSALVTKTLI